MEHNKPNDMESLVDIRVLQSFLNKLMDVFDFVLILVVRCIKSHLKASGVMNNELRSVGMSKLLIDIMLPVLIVGDFRLRDS